MKKKSRLKKEVKERLIAILVVIGFFLLTIGLLIYAQDRINKINSGEMILIHDNQAD